MNNMLYDVSIIGAGPAGLTAALYLARSGRTVALIDKDGYGGNLNRTPRVENIPGFTAISGPDFNDRLYNQVMQYDAVEHLICEIKLVRYAHKMFKLNTEDNQLICSRSVIVATGTEYRRLDLPTNSVYYCATCDGPLFTGKSVMVVGSGNTGAVFAEELSEYCDQVYICDVTPDMCCEQCTKQKLLAKTNVHWLPNCSVTSVINDAEHNLQEVVLSTLETIPCSAIFAAIGMQANTELFKQFFDFDDNGFIKSYTSKIPGLFAAGDCCAKLVRQVTTATSDGTIMAIAANAFLKES